MFTITIRHKDADGYNNYNNQFEEGQNKPFKKEADRYFGAHPFTYLIAS